MPSHAPKPAPASPIQPPHPATVAQRREPHPATVARPKAQAATAQRRTPHAATVAQRTTSGREVVSFKQSDLGNGKSFGLCVPICIYILRDGLWDRDFQDRNDCKDVLERFHDRAENDKKKLLSDLMNISMEIDEGMVTLARFSAYQAKKVNLVILTLWNDSLGTKTTGHCALMITSASSGDTTIFDPDVGGYTIRKGELQKRSLEDILLEEHQRAGNNVHKVVIVEYNTLKK